jgi:hypothetical protein
MSTLPLSLLQRPGFKQDEQLLEASRVLYRFFALLNPLHQSESQGAGPAPNGCDAQATKA